MLGQNVTVANRADGIALHGVSRLFGKTAEHDALRGLDCLCLQQRFILIQHDDILLCGRRVRRRLRRMQLHCDGIFISRDLRRRVGRNHELRGELAVAARRRHRKGGADQALCRDAHEGLGAAAVRPCIGILARSTAAKDGRGHGIRSARLRGNGDGCDAVDLRLAGHGEILRLEPLIRLEHVPVGRLLAADKGFPGCNGLLQRVPVVGCAVLSLRQLFALRDQIVEHQKHLEHIVLVRDLVHQLIIEPVAVIGGDDRLVVDAQTVRLHRVEETVEKRLGQIADEHEFGVVVPAVIRGGRRLIALESGQIADGLVEILIGHFHDRDIKLGEDRAQTRSARGVAFEVIQDDAVFRDLIVRRNDRDGGGNVVYLFALPLHMGQAQLDEELFARLKRRRVVEVERQLSPSLAAHAGVGLGDHAADAEILPKLIVLDLIVRIFTGAGIDRHVAVELVAHRQILVRVIDRQGDGGRVALDRADRERCVGRAPIRRGLHNQHRRARFFSAGRQHKLQLAANLQTADADIERLIGLRTVQAAGDQHLRRFSVQRIAVKLIELVFRIFDAAVKAHGCGQIRHACRNLLRQQIGAGLLLFGGRLDRYRLRLRQKRIAESAAPEARYWMPQ